MTKSEKILTMKLKLIGLIIFQLKIRTLEKNLVFQRKCVCRGVTLNKSYPQNSWKSPTLIA